MTLRIHNTLTRPPKPSRRSTRTHVRMYVCGITVYDFCHVGHARIMMVFDMVRRWLRAHRLRVTYVRNITDIDDKIIRRARERGSSIGALTDAIIAAMHEDVAALGHRDARRTSRAPPSTCRQMLEMIGALEREGPRLSAGNGDVNYAVRKFPGYGKLSGKSLDELRAGARVAVLDGKRDPLDFVLWKPAKAERARRAWAARWARAARAGTSSARRCHARCSATTSTSTAAARTCSSRTTRTRSRRAKARAARRFVEYWMHNGFLNVDDEKMSKSLGNFFTMRDVLQAATTPRRCAFSCCAPTIAAR